MTETSRFATIIYTFCVVFTIICMALVYLYMHVCNSLHEHITVNRIWAYLHTLSFCVWLLVNGYSYKYSHIRAHYHTMIVFQQSITHHLFILIKGSDEVLEKGKVF